MPLPRNFGNDRSGCSRVLTSKTPRHKGQPIRAEVQAITIGDEFAWVGLPGEVFAELGMMIKANSPYRFTVVNELANDMLDYIPNRRAYAEGSYEVTTARCAIGCGSNWCPLLSNYWLTWPAGPEPLCRNPSYSNLPSLFQF